MPTDCQMKSRRECLEKVHHVSSELKAEIPDNVIELDHRIGKMVKFNGKDDRQMIIRLTTCRHRTMVY